AGNPFFLRELLLNLLEEGTLERQDASRLAIDATGIPDGAREVIARRLPRLRPRTPPRLLATASGCPGPFRFDVVARAADLDEHAALDGLDAALAARLPRGGAHPGRHEVAPPLQRR